MITSIMEEDLPRKNELKELGSAVGVVANNATNSTLSI